MSTSIQIKSQKNKILLDYAINDEIALVEFESSSGLEHLNIKQQLVSDNTLYKAFQKFIYNYTNPYDVNYIYNNIVVGTLTINDKSTKLYKTSMEDGILYECVNFVNIR